MTALTRLISATAACLVLAFAAACNDSEPLAPAPSTPPASVASSPTPTAPVEPPLPDAATQPGKAGAEAFVRHYWDMVNYAMATGNVDGLKGLAAPGCKPCNVGVERLRTLYESSQIEGGEYEVLALTARPLPDPDKSVDLWTTDAHIRNEAQVVTGVGKEAQTFPASKKQFRFYLRFRDDAWSMTGWMVEDL